MDLMTLALANSYTDKKVAESGGGGSAGCNVNYIRFTGGGVSGEQRPMTDEEATELTKAEWAAGIWAEISLDGNTYTIPCGYTANDEFMGFAGVFAMETPVGAVLARLLVSVDGSLWVDVPSALSTNMPM